MPRSKAPSHMGRHSPVAHYLMRGRDLDRPAHEPRRESHSPAPPDRRPRMRVLRSTEWGAAMAASTATTQWRDLRRLTPKLSCKRSAQYAAHQRGCTSIAIGGNRNASDVSALASCSVSLGGRRATNQILIARLALGAVPERPQRLAAQVGSCIGCLLVDRKQLLDASEETVLAAE